jgi:AcrR family transcriptional regulator
VHLLYRGVKCRRELEPSSPASARQKLTDDAILDAACTVFAAEGFDRTTMTAIAVRAGTTKPTLYARVGSKEQIFEAAVKREYDLLVTQLFTAYDTRAEEPFRQSLHRWTAAYFDFVRDRPDGFRLQSEGERHAAAATIIRRADDRIIARIAELIAQVSGRATGAGERLVAAMIAGMLTWCAREAVGSGVELDAACALCESYLYTALRTLDLDLVEAA